jgi:hypothetical protein
MPVRSDYYLSIQREVQPCVVYFMAVKLMLARFRCMRCHLTCIVLSCKRSVFDANVLFLQRVAISITALTSQPHRNARNGPFECQSAACLDSIHGAYLLVTH